MKSRVQPTKLAAMEGSGKRNLHLHRSMVAWPEQDQERNAFAIKKFPRC